jgi:arginase
MPAQLQVISVPFHNGLRGVGMGRGAARLSADQSFREALSGAGWTVSAREIEPVDESLPEVARVIELIRRQAVAVQEAADAGAFPLVLAGNCNSSLGTVSGVGPRDLGVVWFDAHADFDDPEENVSGFFDVMGLAILTGRGWRALRSTIPGYEPVPEGRVLLAAVRDLEPYQRATVERSSLLVAAGQVDGIRFDEALGELRARVERVYLHVDLDSLDVSAARANQYAAAGGPSLERLCECVTAVCERFTVAAAALTAYDPAFDDGDRTLAAARTIAGVIARTVR